MKKIITLALAAVMTLGLTVLPQAKTPEEAYTEQDGKVKTAEKELNDKKAELKIAQDTYNLKVETEKKAGKTGKDLREAVKAEKEKLDDAQDAVATAQKALDEAKAELAKLEYTYVTIKDERTGKLLAQEVVVKSGSYTVDELMAATGADKNAEHGWVLADKQSKYVTISGRHTTVVVKVATKVQIFRR